MVGVLGEAMVMGVLAKAAEGVPVRAAAEREAGAAGRRSGGRWGSR